jgi:hypothetical protein
MGRFPPELEVLILEFHLEVSKCVFDVTISLDPQDCSDAIWTFVSTVFIEDRMAILPHLRGWHLRFVSDARGE